MFWLFMMYIFVKTHQIVYLKLWILSYVKYINKKYREKSNVKSPRKYSKMSDKGRKIVNKYYKGVT